MKYGYFHVLCGRNAEICSGFVSAALDDVKLIKTFQKFCDEPETTEVSNDKREVML